MRWKEYSQIPSRKKSLLLSTVAVRSTRWTCLDVSLRRCGERLDWRLAVGRELQLFIIHSFERQADQPTDLTWNIDLPFVSSLHSAVIVIRASIFPRCRALSIHKMELGLLRSSALRGPRKHIYSSPEPPIDLQENVSHSNNSNRDFHSRNQSSPPRCL